MGRRKNKSANTVPTFHQTNFNTKYDVLDDIIENIYNDCVKINEEETKALNERFGKVIDVFVNKMIEVDETFGRIFNRIHFTGSYYDGLRIDEATEFDLNLILKTNWFMEPVRKRRPPGFTSVQLLALAGLQGENPYKDWVENRGFNNFLNPDSVKCWFQGVVVRTLKKLQEDGNSILGCQLELRESGPAWTLSISTQEPPRKTIDIDLAPVLEFNTSKRGIPPMKKRDIRSIGLDKPWFAVPKPPNCPNCHCIAWRMSFPIQETAIIQDLKFFKYTLKMIKKVRDALGIHEVASYHIKNLFLLELQKQGRDMWSENRRGHLFMHMLECFRTALENGKIPFLWNENLNLIGNISKATLENRVGRLNRFCDKIHELTEKIDKMTKENKNSEEETKNLKSFIESELNAQKEKTKMDDEDSNSDTEADSESDTESEVSHVEGLKAMNTLLKYTNQQGGATLNDVNVLLKWKAHMNLNKSK